MNRRKLIGDLESTAWLWPASARAAFRSFPHAGHWRSPFPATSPRFYGLSDRTCGAQLLPGVEWDNLRYLRYVIGSVREYRAQHILYGQRFTRMEKSKVFAGVGKDVIHDEGHVWSLSKSPKWEITGYAYWASSNVAPADTCSVITMNIESSPDHPLQRENRRSARWQQTTSLPRVGSLSTSGPHVP